jgi:thiosulfate/3-mercaptopyruvate sulfurtransferase
MTSAGDVKSLVTTDWVASQLGGGLKLIEVDEDTEAYGWGHIPGAIALSWLTDLQEPVARNIVDQAGFEALMGSRGVTETDQVILYGGNNNWFAAYAYWLFKLYGHPDVKLMDGGRKKWELEQREITADVPEVTPTRYSAKPADTSIRALRDEVLSAIGKVSMIDVRSSPEYAGLIAAPPHLPHEQAQRKGHIPEAKNVPWSKAANEDGSFRSRDELLRLYTEEGGLTPQRPVIAYCRIGERSAHTWFVLREILGFEAVKNYDGSWTEYGSLVGVPIVMEPQSPGSR